VNRYTERPIAQPDASVEGLAFAGTVSGGQGT